MISIIIVLLLVYFEMAITFGGLAAIVGFLALVINLSVHQVEQGIAVIGAVDTMRTACCDVNADRLILI